MSISGLQSILVIRDIKAPVAGVLDAPVIANTLRETGNITGQAAEVVPNLRVLVSALDERVND